MKYILCILLVLIPPAFARFNRTSGLIDIPSARILPHLGYRFGTDLSFKLDTGSRDEVFEENLFKASFGFGDILEFYFDIYTINPGSFTAAGGFCNNFYRQERVAIAWGIHSLSWATHVSEIAHGDSTGWHDDLMYYAGDYSKPYEVGSIFLVSTYALSDNIDLTLGLGRGRYVGYGEVSKYFNSNFYHEEGGDWGIGLFGGLELKANEDLSFMLEGDGRDINVGVVYKPLPWEFGLALTKCEYFENWDEFRPRVALSLAYVKIPKRPGPGNIAGTVSDTKNNPLSAEVIITMTEIPPMLTDSEGSYAFTEIEPKIYELKAWARGYTREKKKVEVLADTTVICNFVLARARGAIIGMVIDKDTEEPLVAQLVLEETDSSTESTADGMFEFRELKPADYTIRADAPGYITGRETATVRAGDTTEVLIKLMKPRTFSLEGVQFDFDKATLRPVSYPILDHAASILINNPDIIVEIQGHTCWLGPDEYNLRLSDARAKSVVDYLLTAHMIDPSRLKARGYGESKPRDTNETREGRERNRRVGFVILE